MSGRARQLSRNDGRLATGLRKPCQPLLEARGVSLLTPSGRALLHDLSMTMHGEHVALIGRNGVGKSSLLKVLAGHQLPHRGKVVRHSDCLLVGQQLDDAPVSDGEQRKRQLLAARRRQPRLLLLDEPTQGLDMDNIDWLIGWLDAFPGGLLVASHHRPLLTLFHHFVVLEESGCRYFPGSFGDLLRDLEARHDEGQRKYLRHLNVLLERERHHVTVSRRRRRKKNLGRLHEEGRAPSRAQLKGKKGYAQQSQGKAAKIRHARIEAVRAFTRASRRALSVRLPLRLLAPQLRAPDGRHSVDLQDVTVGVSGRTLFRRLNLRLTRERLGVVGPNGAGKTTLLRLIAGEQLATAGAVSCRPLRLGHIAQAARDWLLDDSLAEVLHVGADIPSADALARLLVAHRFPLALAQRPLRSLSPGERVRAALISLFQRSKAPETLVLDEPSYSLDFVGAAALIAGLRVWPGGLIVASHDRDFLAAIGITRYLKLDGQGGHAFSELLGC